MRLIKITLYTLIVFGFFACDKEDNTTEEQTVENFIFEDGFETAGNSLQELFPSDGSRWSNLQQVNPNNGENEIEIENNYTVADY